MDKEILQNMLQQGQDDLLLRFALGQALLNEGNAHDAIQHFEKALVFDEQHSSSWKLLGKSLVEAGDGKRAVQVFEKGIEVAQSRGDIQAAKEMRIFLRRLQKATD
jgi:predicted Zn-dependent protease